VSDPRFSRPRQAVLVAGGRGTRLGPLTEHRPKALVEVGGRPFLDWLIESVRDRGFERILLLLGYRAADIQRHCGDGSRWGVQVDTVATDPSDETARRFLAAMPKIEERFLFLYCDNLWPMPFEAMWRRYTEAGLPAMVTVYTNEDGYTRSNVRIGENETVEAYDRSRTQGGLAGVEIGYGIFDRSVLESLDGTNLSLQDAVYPGLISRRNLQAFPTGHRYYGIGKLDRLPATERFLTGSPAVIVDRDGVLNEKPPQARYVRSWAEWRWLPGALDALALLTRSGRRVFIVSNQAGVGRGAMTEGDLQDIHEHMLEDIAVAGGRVDGIYFCPHDWDDGCTCRKPRPGMLFQAQREHDLDLSRTPFIGDDERDAMAAEAAGAPSLMVGPGRSLLDVVQELLAEEAREVVA
jgi:histidinol-phosphate phosphatase family protein